MSKYRRESQIVNNFFTLASIIMISIVITLYSKYGPQNTTKRIHSNLACQQITPTIDNIISKKLIYEASDLLKKGAYILDGGFIKPRFGKSYLSTEVSISDANSYFKNSISITQKKDINKFINIKYEIIENDKNDPRKKGDESKNFAGKIMTSFRINGKEAFRMHTDFLQYDKYEIKEKIDCTIKAFRHNAK